MSQCQRLEGTHIEASAQGIPERVTDRMLKRIAIFSGVPLVLGFSTGPIFYGLKVIAHADVAPWYVDHSLPVILLSTRNPPFV